MKFSARYPLFILTKDDEDDLAILDLADGPTHVKGVAVFTDEAAAVEFRDSRYQGWRLAMIPDEAFFARLLICIKGAVVLVAFDPYRMGMRTHTISVDEMLRQLTD